MTNQDSNMHTLPHSPGHDEREIPGQNSNLAEMVLETTDFLVVVLDKEGYIVRFNPACERTTGYESREVVGKLLWDFLIPPEQVARVQGVFHSLEFDQMPNRYEDFWKTKDGQCRLLSWSNTLLRDDTGTVQYIIGTGQDVTERKQRETAVSIFQTMADTAPDGFGMANADGTLTYANAAYRTLTGYGDALIGMNFLDHFTDADRAKAIEALSTTAKQGDWQGVLNFQHQDGTIIPVDTKGFVTRNEAGNIIAIMGLFRDLREQYRQEAERTALQQQIIEAQRATLQELSAPLLPISEQAVVLPLVGSIDSQRAQQIMETLLDGVAANRATIAIIDITGVQVVDTQVANALIQAAQAVQLLGAQVILTGIGPVMAQTLVHLGVDLSGIVTRSTLQNGITYAMHTQHSL
jgi:rsbT co-antagonist protein RsbR